MATPARRPDPSRGPEPVALDVRVVGMHYAPEATGNAPYTTGMVAALAGAGHRVEVVTGYPHYPQWRIPAGYGGLRRHEEIDGVPVTRVRHPVPAIPDARRRVVMDAAFALHAATAGGTRPDVVVAVSPVLLTVAAGLRWRRRGRTALGVVTQDLYSRALRETGMTSERVARWGARLEGALLRAADGVAVVHERFVAPVGELGVDRDRITVIPNWTHVAPSARDRARTRQELGWAPDEVIALHAGNMGLKQGLENVVEAGRAADAAGARVRFVLLGEGGRRAALEGAAAGVGAVTFLDPLPDGRFADALAAADVLVVNEAPTVAEMSAPSKLTSYFAAGRPVVAATWAHSAAAAEVRRSGAGVLVDPGKPAALLDAVRDLAADPGAELMGGRGRRYAREHLGRAEAYRAYDEWVRGLASGRVLGWSQGRSGPSPRESR